MMSHQPPTKSLFGGPIFHCKGKGAESAEQEHSTNETSQCPDNQIPDEESVQNSCTEAQEQQHASIQEARLIEIAAIQEPNTDAELMHTANGVGDHTAQDPTQTKHVPSPLSPGEPADTHDADNHGPECQLATVASPDVPQISSDDSATRYNLRQAPRQKLLDYELEPQFLDSDESGHFDPACKQDPQVIANRKPERLCEKRSRDIGDADEASRPPKRHRARISLEQARRNGEIELAVFNLKIISEEKLSRLLQKLSSSIDNWPYADDSDEAVDGLAEISDQHIIEGPRASRNKPQDEQEQRPADMQGGQIENRGCKNCLLSMHPESFRRVCTHPPDMSCEDDDAVKQHTRESATCSLVRGGKYPCDFCRDNEEECQLVNEPPKKDICLQCNRGKNRTMCSFLRNRKQRGPCDQCATKNWDCVAGPHWDVPLPPTPWAQGKSLAIYRMREKTAVEQIWKKSGFSDPAKRRGLGMHSNREASQKVNKKSRTSPRRVTMSDEKHAHLLAEGEPRIRSSPRLQQTSGGGRGRGMTSNRSLSTDHDPAAQTAQDGLNGVFGSNPTQASRGEKTTPKSIFGQGKSNRSRNLRQTDTDTELALMLEAPDDETNDEMLRRIRNAACWSIDDSCDSLAMNSPRPGTDGSPDDQYESLFVTPPPEDRQTGGGNIRSGSRESPADGYDINSEPSYRRKRSSNGRTGIRNGRHYKHFSNSAVVNKHLARLQEITTEKSWAALRPRITTHVYGRGSSDFESLLFARRRPATGTFVVRSNLEHPVRLNSEMGCNWCESKRFHYCGLGVVSKAHIKKQSNGIWIEVAKPTNDGGNRKVKAKRKKYNDINMCSSCVKVRRLIMQCGTHKMQPMIDRRNMSTLQLLDAINNETQNPLQPAPPMCQACVSAATHKCADEKGCGCDLHLCSDCSIALTHHRANLELLLHYKERTIGDGDYVGLRGDVCMFAQIKDFYEA